jgi:hypothetical protein
LVLIALMGCGDRGISAGERGRLLAMRPVWIAAARAERCPRPALRTPITGDGSARLLSLNDKKSPERRCLERVKELRSELGPCLPHEPCGPQTLAGLEPHSDVVEACAPLYAAVEELAHASEACSPISNSIPDDDIGPVAALSLGNAVRLEVAPLAANGQVAEASKRVLDAMRFADDLARNSTILGVPVSTAISSRLVDTLDELAIDPRLTADEARAISRDLDVLLASSPRWDAVMRQEQAWVADWAASHSEDMIAVLASVDVQAADTRRVCSGTLRDCVEHFDEMKAEGATVFQDYARRLGMRDSALAFVRMQIELRLARPEDCADPVRRRAILEPWADRAVVGDEREPVVTPPTWQRVPSDAPRRVPRVLRCVPATI